MSKVLIIGGGAAGMMAAVFAARNGHETVLFEKNEKLGKKLYITGKGRCNITNACERDTFFTNVVSNSKFLYGAFKQFNPYDVIDFFESLNLPVKIERGNRVFPSSDKSSDVIGAMKQELHRLNVEVRYRTEAERIILKDNRFFGVQIKGEKQPITGDSLIVATGGLSYPVTGSTGDGYRFAREMGHSITDLSPALVPIHVSEAYVKELMGLTLKNVEIHVKAGEKTVYRDFGEMLFTHFGLSGPLILSASSYIAPYMKRKEKLILSIDLKPALSEEQLDTRILRDFNEFINKQFKNSLEHLLPNKLIDVIIRLSEINPDKKVNLITREERLRLVHLLKNLPFRISALSEYNQAVITKGGISVKEINPSTMESKLADNVYFIGEVLDLDALTGGFNLQIAWSTAYIAGNSIR